MKKMIIAAAAAFLMTTTANAANIVDTAASTGKFNTLLAAAKIKSAHVGTLKSSGGYHYQCAQTFQTGLYRQARVISADPVKLTSD